MEFKAFYHVSHEEWYLYSDRLATKGTLGATMNIWKEAMYKAEDQLFLAVL